MWRSIEERILNPSWRDLQFPNNVSHVSKILKEEQTKNPNKKQKQTNKQSFESRRQACLCSGSLRSGLEKTVLSCWFKTVKVKVTLPLKTGTFYKRPRGPFRKTKKKNKITCLRNLKSNQGNKHMVTILTWQGCEWLLRSVFLCPAFSLRSSDPFPLQAFVCSIYFLFCLYLFIHSFIYLHEHWPAESWPSFESVCCLLATFSSVEMRLELWHWPSSFLLPTSPWPWLCPEPLELSQSFGTHLKFSWG